MEHNGRDRARPYVERAGAEYPAVADEASLTTDIFGFKVVPNGVLVDEDGIVRWAKFGGFSIDNPSDVATVERFLAGEPVGESPVASSAYDLDATEQELADTRVRLGRLLESLGQRDAAVAEWQAALRRDPANFVIRKQIWSALYPEKFYPTIDFAWQSEQLAREREAEIAAGYCGPDGCPIRR